MTNLLIFLGFFAGGWMLGRLCFVGFLYWRMSGSFVACRNVYNAWRIARDKRTDERISRGMKEAWRRGLLKDGDQ